MLFNKLTIATFAASAVQSSAAASIYDIAGTTDGFGTLAAAVNAAGLADALSGDGTFTVFAPTDDAFAALPEGLVTKLLDPIWQPQLKDVILYHALDSEVDSTMLTDGMTATTLNGEDITINLDPPRVNDDANILISDGLVDVAADNGLIHGVDAVLTPTSVTTDIVGIAAANQDTFSTLVAAVTAADLVETLSGPGPFTVFAPTDEAFANVDEDTLAMLLLPENKDKLIDILSYHVVSANAHSSGLESGLVETVNGDSVTIGVSDDGVMVNGANVVMADVLASNGIIHVIDTVLMPPEESTDSTTMPTDLSGATEVPPSADEAETAAPTQKPTAMPTEASGANAYGTVLAAAAIATGVAIIA